jgi:hypothetical protein
MSETIVMYFLVCVVLVSFVLIVMWGLSISGTSLLGN